MKKLQRIYLLLTCLAVLACSGEDPAPIETDTQSPTAPSNLVISNITDSSLRLSWSAASDNIGVTGYNIYQDGQLVQTLTATSFTIGGLMADTAYSYFVTAVDAAANESSSSNTVSVTTAAAPLEFKPLLSEMGIFQGNFEDLIPAEGVQLYEIHSTLFTDYAYKQRLIKLPDGASMTYNGTDLLPEFPNNTLIAKTFYYNIDDRDPSLGKKIIETRLFLKLEAGWQATDYIWNASQTDAVQDNAGGVLPISYIDSNGTTQNVDYEIPSQEQCFTCHNNNDNTFPIGLKLRNINFVPSYTTVNQLQYFINNGLITGAPDPGAVSVLPDWKDDITYSLDERARAYLDINCAHCHQPGGSVPPTFMIDFRLETPFNQTLIYPNRGEIEARFGSTAPTYRMPQLGRTVIHQEAFDMLVDYLESLD